MEQKFAVEIAKLFVFSIFVTAFLEVLKVVYLRFDKDGMKTETMKIFNFLLALLFCYAFDYGVMSRIISAGDSPKGALADWLDYLATAAVIYMGADWVFQKFAASVAKAKAIRAEAESVQGSTTTVKRTEVVDSTTTKTKDP